MSENNKMHIVYHYRVRGIGAEGVHIAGISNGFRKQGYRVTFVSPPAKDPTRQTYRKGRGTPVGRMLNYLADHAPQLIFEAMEILYNVYATWKLRKQLLKDPAEFVYERYAFFNIAGMIVSHSLGIPLVVEVNELSGYKRVRGQVLVGISKFLERAVLKQATLIVVVSEFLKNKITGMIGSDEKIIVIPNGIKRSWIHQTVEESEVRTLREKWRLDDRHIIGFLGGLTHWHNFELLVEATATVAKTCPKVCLLLIGDGPHKEHILDKAQKLGIEDRLVFTGNVPHSEVQQYLSLFDVAVIPHSNEYRSPIKLFEYMGCGRFVVAPDLPPIRSVLTHGVDGLLFKPDNLEELANNIRRGLQNPDFREQTGKIARELVKHKFLWEKHSVKIINSLKK